MDIGKYVLRRLLTAIPVLIGVTLITFTMTHIIGNPLAAYAPAYNPDIWNDPQAIQMLKERYHLNEPIINQYFWYMSRLLRGNWGYSLSAGMPVTKCITTYFPATVELTLSAMFVAFVIGITLGVLSAAKRGSSIDQFARVFSLSGRSLPIYWFGLMMMYFFHYQFYQWGLPMLPAGGRLGTMASLVKIRRITGLILLDTLIQGEFSIFLSAAIHLLLPALTLGFYESGILVRLTRSGMLDVMQQDYMIFARAKGLKERQVLYKHGLRNGVTSTLSFGGYLIAALLGGAVLTETTFSWPGMGQWVTRGILINDIPAIMGFTLFFALIFIAADLIVDIIHARIDPRVRLK